MNEIKKQRWQILKQISKFRNMELKWVSESNFLMWSLIIISPPLLLLLLLHRRRYSRSNRQPPGPPGWPVFGYMFNLGTMPHRTLFTLKQKYGSVVWLKLASTNTMVILTAKSAADFFKNHDVSFADRIITHTMCSHDFHKSSISVAPYGAYWRVLRRLCTVEMFTSKRVNETSLAREECVGELIAWIEEEARSGDEARGIHVARLVFLAAFNMIGKLVLSRGLVDHGSKVGLDFFTAMDGIAEWAGSPNISDLFPWVSGLDLQGLRRKMDRDKGKALEIASGFVKQRIEEREEGIERKNDLLDVLLDFEGSGKDEPAKLLEKDVNIFILEMLMAGSETTSSTVEWALTEILYNPEVMIQVKDELNKILALKNKFDESDIENLPYLQAVIKETLRLHPPLPFLVPRRATQDVNFMGYHIPKSTQVFVNTWAIGRDSECWDDPLSFKPERFLGSKIDFRGQHFEFIPFGAGRRMCPGIPLAQRMVPLILGSLLFEFDWELDDCVTLETMDMREKMGMSMKKLEPLKVIPKRSKV